MVLAFFAGLGVWEILLILVVALIVFGPRLPEVAKSLGKGYMEFRRGLRSFESEFDIDDADVEIHDSPPLPDPGDDDADPEGGGGSVGSATPDVPAEESREEEETT